MPSDFSKEQQFFKRVATLTIHGPGKMTAQGRDQVADWLEYQADALREEGEQYSLGVFTATYSAH